jgi:hypothetical protein
MLDDMDFDAFSKKMYVVREGDKLGVSKFNVLEFYI